MRISMKYNGFPASCETATYGVEDYTVNLVAATLQTRKLRQLRKSLLYQEQYYNNKLILDSRNR
jgi:hypothetical protein